MIFQIYAGRAKGLSLFLPKQEIRPTAVTLRRKLFDRFQDMQDFIFVDLCSGTGAMGIEAFSRGCADVVLVEKDRQVFFNLKKNVELVQRKVPEAESQIQLFKDDVENYLKNQLDHLCSKARSQSKKLFLYFDPPYELVNVYHKVFAILSTPSCDDIYFAIEADTQKTFQTTVIEQIFPIGKTYWQGTHFIYLIEPK